MIRSDQRYDSLAQWSFQETFPGDVPFDWRIIRAVIKKESNFDPMAMGAAGDAGLMQLLPATLALYGVVHPYNPEDNIRVGVKVLHDKWAIFTKEQGLERLRFALAAYNSGEKHIIDAQALLAQRGRPTDQWIEIIQVLPAVIPDSAAAVKAYVREVMADYLSQVA